MDFYLAAPYAARDHAQILLKEYDVASTARWLEATHFIHAGTLDTAPAMSDEYAYLHSQQDLADIDKADSLVLLTGFYCRVQWGIPLSLTTSGGRHIETGYALAHGKRVIVVGEPENIFHRGLCTVVPDFETALKEIR